MGGDHRVNSASRRRFCWTLASVLVAPSVATAQAPTVVRRIGVLESGAPDTPEDIRRQAEPLRELGWVEGQNLAVERRFAKGRLEALRSLAEELVRAKVEIIVTAGTPATLAAKRATTTIPIVIRTAGDPVLLGLVAGLARPGGNVTGYTEVTAEVDAKFLSILKELLPRVLRIRVLWDAGNPYKRATRGQFEHVCQSLGLVPIIVETGAADDAERVIAQLVHQRVQALVISSGLTWDWDKLSEAVGIATKYSLPTIGDESEMVRQAGTLIAYSTTWAEQYRRRAEYIDRILRGAKPADLPVQQPTKFELLINLKTARALGLTIPKELLLRADEVIR